MAASDNLTLRCTKCEADKPPEAFARRSARKRGYQSWCKECCKAYRDERSTHRSSLRRAYYSKNRNRILLVSKERRSTDGYRTKARALKYGLTTKELTALLGKGCSVCGKKEVSSKLVVDHDHSCCPGQESCGLCVRGALCYKCNRDMHVVDSAALPKLIEHRMRRWKSQQ